VEKLLDEGHVVGWLTADVPLTDRDREIQDKIDTARQISNFFVERYGRLHTIKMPILPEAYAAVLYDCLHLLDALNVTRIVVDKLPETEAWLAIRDRLNRAATPNEP
jgi:hypothetical protein